MLAKGRPESPVRSRKSVRVPGVSAGYFRRKRSLAPCLSRLLARPLGAALRIGVLGARLKGLCFISWPEQRCGSPRARPRRVQKADLVAKQEGLRCSRDR
jgi:hypothetical protein